MPCIRDGSRSHHERYLNLYRFMQPVYDGSVPEISRFFGIVVFMNNDHPPPHFHVRYGRTEGNGRDRVAHAA